MHHIYYTLYNDVLLNKIAACFKLLFMLFTFEPFVSYFRNEYDVEKKNPCCHCDDSFFAWIHSSLSEQCSQATSLWWLFTELDRDPVPSFSLCVKPEAGHRRKEKNKWPNYTNRRGTHFRRERLFPSFLTTDDLSHHIFMTSKNWSLW